MRFADKFVNCLFTTNDDIMDILEQLKNGTIFKAGHNDAFDGDAILEFQTRISTQELGVFWLTNSERRRVIKELHKYLEMV